MIRKATPADMDALAVMAERFIAFSPHAGMVQSSDAQRRAAMQWVIDNGCIFVAEVGDTIVGMLMAVISPTWFAPDTPIATELAWWVDEHHRKGTAAIRLVQAFEEWAKESGAAIACMCEMVVEGQPPVGDMIQRMGYIPSERAFIKEI